MTDRETVIKALEYCAAGTNDCSKCPMTGYCHGVSNAALAAAAKLLKAQEPVAPIQPELSGIWFCGSCKYAISRNFKFCPNCGMVVKWE